MSSIKFFREDRKVLKGFFVKLHLFYGQENSYSFVPMENNGQYLMHVFIARNFCSQNYFYRMAN
jgi:hypothetical protein